MNNKETYLASLAGEYSGDLPAPRPLRQEMYLAKMAGVYDGELPAPVTCEDEYLYELAENGSVGGGGTCRMSDATSAFSISTILLETSAQLGTT